MLSILIIYKMLLALWFKIYQLGDVLLAWRLLSLVKSDPRLRNVPDNVPKLLALSLIVE